MPTFLNPFRARGTGEGITNPYIEGYTSTTSTSATTTLYTRLVNPTITTSSTSSSSIYYYCIGTYVPSLQSLIQTTGSLIHPLYNQFALQQALQQEIHNLQQLNVQGRQLQNEIDAMMQNPPPWAPPPRPAEPPPSTPAILKAVDRARELLLSHLTPKQRETFEKNKWFVVEGGFTKNKYRINDLGHLVANIDVLYPDGTRKSRLCAHCADSFIPLYDSLLAQKLMLESDETDFLKIANHHR